MRNFNLYLLLLLAIGGIWSCSDDDNDNPCEGQPLSGLINDKEFNLGEVRVDIDSEEVYIALFHEDEDVSGNVCEMSTISANEIVAWTRIDNQTGEQALSVDKRLQMFDPDGTVNIIIGNGTIEILSIDQNSISVRFDVGSDEDRLCGEVTAPICN